MTTDNRSAYNLCCLAAIVFLPAFYFLDILYYPAQKGALLTIRLTTVAVFIVIRYFVLRVKREHLFPLTVFAILVGLFATSMLCLFTGQGFTSPYYAATLEGIIIISLLLFQVGKKEFTLILLAAVIQHFIVLSFGPFDLRGFLLQVMILGSISIASALIHNLVFDLTEEVKTLKGFIPICAHCKKIRNDEGFWFQVEEYIQEHSEAEFLKGYCPECEAKDKEPQAPDNSGQPEL